MPYDDNNKYIRKYSRGILHLLYKGSNVNWQNYLIPKFKINVSTLIQSK